jgi:hypothetical protein
LIRAYLVHAIDGRLRIRVPAIKNNAALANDLRDALQAIPDVGLVVVNPVTASLTMTYDGERLSRARLCAHIGGVFGKDLTDARRPAAPRLPAPPLPTRDQIVEAVLTKAMETAITRALVALI